jgi:hypothetical protein
MSGTEINIVGLESYRLKRHTTAGDGSCMLHAYMQASYEPYRTGIKYGVAVERSVLARDFRDSLATKLEMVKTSGKTVYETLANGNLAEFGQGSPDLYSLPAIKKQLLSNEWLGDETLTLLEYILERNIYVYDRATSAFKISDGIEQYDKAVVLYFDGGHYETMSCLNNDGVESTHFFSSSNFIQKIRKLSAKPAV